MGKTIVIDGKKIKLSPESSDPELEQGMLWFRSDTGEIKFSPDGSETKIVHPTAWGDITGKPSTYPPEAHTHERGDITDLFNSPFWDNIPDKPSEYPPEAHTHSASEITSGRLSLDRLPTGTSGYVLEGQGTASPAWVNPNGRYTPASHSHSRGDITNFFSSPFWDNIPDKPSEFPPEAHTHDDRYYTKTQLQTSGQSSVHWNNITNKPSTYPPSTHTHTKSDITDFAHDHSGDILRPAEIRVGDIKFANGWVLTEDDEHGLVFISPNGKKYKMMLVEVP